MLTILSGALILLAALMLSVGGLALVYRFVPVSLLQAHYGATGAIYAALYVMFGISLGFSLYLVWQQYEAARSKTSPSPTPGGRCRRSGL